MATAQWSRRLCRLSFALAILALAVAGSGLTLARYDMIGKIPGFLAMLGGAAVAALASLIAVIGLLLAIRNSAAGRRAGFAALLLALPLALFIFARPLIAAKAPPIHDVTTNLEAPPQFEALTPRGDNLAGVETVERWRQVHSESYPDLKSVTIDRPVSAVIADAKRIALERGWEIAAFDPARGRLEAVASVSYIRFRDDIVVVVRPTPDGQGSIVDMRSVSRVGVSDLGINAKRIRAFLSALAAK